MLTPNTATVTRPELGRFMRAVAARIDRDGAPETTELVLAVKSGAGPRLLIATDSSSASTTARVDQLLKGGRIAALASITGWSPSPVGRTVPSWSLVAVGVGGVPAELWVRRIREDAAWWELDFREAPWFALATASGLRAALDLGRPLRLKQAKDARLLQRPGDCAHPPVDGRGGL